MKKILLLLLLASTCAFAQTSVNQVIILNEGYYNFSTGNQDVLVTIGSYDPASHIYTTFETIAGAQFASDVIVDGNYIYAACSNGIRKYDKITRQLLYTNTTTGVRKMAVWNNELLVTRGDYLVLNNNYFQSYNTSDLSFNYQIDNVIGPAFSTEGIAVYGDSCFIALNNGFNFPNYVGKIGVIYLPTHTYAREFDLGTIGVNPDYLTINNGEIYTVNNRDFSNASISKYEINSGALSTTDLMVSSGCGTSVYANNDLLFQVSGEQNLKKFSTSSLTTYDSLMINQPIYGMAHDAVNNLLYAGVTDFYSYGKILVYNNSGSVVDSFLVGVSPGNIAIDYNGPLAVDQLNAARLEIFPNPSNDFIVVKTDNPLSIKIYDAIGNVVITTNVTAIAGKINIRDLKPGLYFIRSINSNIHLNQKFIKQ
ncbi:MAG: T9SS type A sorting domain-containing protein [Bacteroidia bacterium]